MNEAILHALIRSAMWLVFAILSVSVGLYFALRCDAPGRGFLFGAVLYAAAEFIGPSSEERRALRNIFDD